VPETCWASSKIWNKKTSVASSWHFISTYIFTITNPVACIQRSRPIHVICNTFIFHILL
jgi:hypothetical protein